jgi:endo-1,4-beta-xylanase
MFSRRETLGAALAAAVGALAPPWAGFAATALPKGATPYGVAVRAELIDHDPDYTRAIVGNCDMVVPEAALKWTEIRPDRETFDFEKGDRIARFAADHGLSMRGHTLAWYGAMPAWTESIATAEEAERELSRHIDRVVTRYRGAIWSWDVVNEPLVDDPSGPDDLRPSIWRRRLGPDYIALALRLAHAADPNAQLVVNEYDIEYEGGRYERKRAALAALLTNLVRRGAPVHGVGVQAHLRGELPIDRPGLTAFARAMRDLGLAILVTELDVIDNKLPADIAERDIAAAARVRDLLSSLRDGAPLSAILTWGITDKFSWTPTYFRRADGLPNRPLPLDASYAPKPFMKVVEEFRTGTAAK